MRNAHPAHPALDDDRPDEFDAEFTDGPPAMGVALILAVVSVLIWFGISLALMTAIDRYAPMVWSVR